MNNQTNQAFKYICFHLSALFKYTVEVIDQMIRLFRIINLSLGECLLPDF